MRHAETPIPGKLYLSISYQINYMLLCGRIVFIFAEQMWLILLCANITTSFSRVHVICSMCDQKKTFDCPIFLERGPFVGGGDNYPMNFYHKQMWRGVFPFVIVAKKLR